MNNVVLIGRLTKDPELRYTTGTQTAVCHITLAVDRPKTGDKKETDFIRVTVFGKQAENTDRYCFKGMQVAVNGSIQTGSYKDRDGKMVYTTDVIASRVEFLGGGKTESEPRPQEPQHTAQYEPQYEPQAYMPEQTSFEQFMQAEEDIPF